MRNIVPCILAAAFLVIPLQSRAESKIEQFKEAEWDWKTGDLIFRNGLNEIDETIRESESGEWATIGILRPSSGGPVVIYVDESLGVTELPLDNFIDGQAYVVFRVSGLEDRTTESFDLGPMAGFSLISTYGTPYDTEMMFENGKLYNAELPFAAALSAGVVLAAPKALREITNSDAPLGKILLKGWEERPYCIEATTKEMCWGWLKNLAIVTPGSIADSSAIQQVYP